jgi:trehalose 6-phosphate phosphatase
VYESSIDSDNGVATAVMGLLGLGRSGLVVDVDGTISPIMARPDDAFVLPRAREALIGLQQRLALVAVVTGRSVADARALVNIDGLTYIGNHGLEVWRDGHPATLPEALPWVPIVTSVLEHVQDHLDPGTKPGVIFENKGATASLHYRLTTDPDDTRRELLQTLARFGTSGLRVEEGRRVINLLPPLHVSKGSAVTWLVHEHALTGIVYLGDDETDAHAFRALDTLRAAGGVRTLSIGVVGPETPPSLRELADISVPTVEAVGTLLCSVLDGLKTSDTMNNRAPERLE